MDTEEDLKIKAAQRTGRSETDEGPYYHTSWWEAYKGGVKGKLGGGTVGAIIGATVGLIVTAAFAVSGGVPLAGIIATFTAAGMMYGAHEFSDVGKMTGAVSAAHEKSEERMKSYGDGKFSELKKDIGDIKRMLSGQPVETTASTAAKPTAHDDNYPTKHHGDYNHTPPNNRKLVYWKIALIGLVVGAAAGAILATGGIAAHVIGAAIGAQAAAAIPATGILGASMAIMGLIGASFGINRDVFRDVFDTTDRLFKGLVDKGRTQYETLSQSPQPQPQASQTVEPPVNTVMFDNLPNYPQSETYHRDKVLASAKQALLSMDHTKHIPH
jgi:hypothetical protein